MVARLEPSVAQHDQLAEWIAARAPAIGLFQRLERLRPPRNRRRIAYFRAHGTHGHVDIAAKQPVRYVDVDEGAVEFRHLLWFLDAGSVHTAVPLGYDAEEGLLWTIVMPGRPLQQWLYWRLQSPSPRAQHDAYEALRLTGRWLKNAQSLPFLGRPGDGYPFAQPPENDFAPVLEAGLLNEEELAVIKEAVCVVRELSLADGRQVWTHGDFGPGNCLVSRASDGIRVRVLDFACPFAGSPRLDAATFSASLAVSAAVRFVTVERIERAQAAFALGYLTEWHHRKAHRIVFDQLASRSREYTLHEGAATLKILGRYARRLMGLPRSLRLPLRLHLRRTVTSRLLMVSSATLGSCSRPGRAHKQPVVGDSLRLPVGFASEFRK